MMTPSFLRRIGVLAVLAGCGASQQGALSPSAQETATLQARLMAGRWRLADYRPDVPLEPMLQALLSAQLRTMVVTFDGRTLVAQSPTVQVTRPYTLQNVAGLEFDLVSPDMQGAGLLQSRCEMSPDGRHIVFHAETDPWNGNGALEREGQ